MRFKLWLEADTFQKIVSVKNPELKLSDYRKTMARRLPRGSQRLPRDSQQAVALIRDRIDYHINLIPLIRHWFEQPYNFKTMINHAKEVVVQLAAMDKFCQKFADLFGMKTWLFISSKVSVAARAFQHIVQMLSESGARLKTIRAEISESFRVALDSLKEALKLVDSMRESRFDAWSENEF